MIQSGNPFQKKKKKNIKKLTGKGEREKAKRDRKESESGLEKIEFSLATRTSRFVSNPAGHYCLHCWFIPSICLFQQHPP